MAVVFLNYLVVYYNCLCFPKGTHIVVALSVHPSEAAFGTYGLIIMLHDKVVELICTSKIAHNVQKKTYNMQCWHVRPFGTLSGK